MQGQKEGKRATNVYGTNYNMQGQRGNGSNMVISVYVRTTACKARVFFVFFFSSKSLFYGRTKHNLPWRRIENKSHNDDVACDQTAREA